jgi:hypothetical protein
MVQAPETGFGQAGQLTHCGTLDIDDDSELGHGKNCPKGIIVIVPSLQQGTDETT